MDIPALWRSFHGCYTEDEPYAWALRAEISERWFRVHSLPQSKRYPESEEEISELLRRQNRVASEIFGDNEKCILFFSELVLADRPALFAELNHKLFGDSDETGLTTMFAAETSWKHGEFDSILLLIAENRQSETLWMNAQTGEIFAPYNGGVDLFFASVARRDKLKLKYKDWLSAYPHGL